MAAIRSVLFNILFYGVWTLFVCVCLLPTLLLDRKYALWVATLYQRGAYYLEKYVLGLDYEVRGIENKPKDGTAYLIASKHQSAHETLKLLLLFGDPAIILKKELLSLPLFGLFLKKIDAIAIDRAARGQSVNSLQEGGLRIKAQNRPIVIFPQGTRVAVDTTTLEKPYKGGVGKLYTALDLPILPVALNGGLYWPRNSFWKKPGKVVIEFLPLIPPGLPVDEMMKKLEQQIETKSQELADEGRRALAR